jgi:hypothetical protein
MRHNVHMSPILLIPAFALLLSLWLFYRRIPRPIPQSSVADWCTNLQSMESALASAATAASCPARKPRVKKTPSISPTQTTKKKRTLPKTLEEYEANRKPLQPLPTYTPNKHLLDLIDSLYTPPNSALTSTPPPPTLLTLLLAPSRFAARTLFTLLRPIQKLYTYFFPR